MGHGGHKGGRWDENIIFAANADAAFGEGVEQTMTVCARNRTCKSHFSCAVVILQTQVEYAACIYVSTCIMFLFLFLSISMQIAATSRLIGPQGLIHFMSTVHAHIKFHWICNASYISVHGFWQRYTDANVILEAGPANNSEEVRNTPSYKGTKILI